MDIPNMKDYLHPLLYNKSDKNVINLLSDFKSVHVNKNDTCQDEIIQKMLIMNKQINKSSSENYKLSIKSDYTQLKISNFKSNENHYLLLTIDNNCNLHFLDYSLPEMTDINPHKIFKPDENISNHVKTFLKYLEQLNEFYINLNTIDELCFVVEPTTTKSKTRTFKFNDRVYLKITVDPWLLKADINFLGPSTDIEHLRKIYNEKIYDWDEGLDIYKNLLRMFDLMYFPMKPSNLNDSSYEKICNICFMYRLDNNQLPIITCNNFKCDVSFHAVCLRKWFSTLENSKTFLKIIMGKCPFCKTKLSTSFTPLLNVENE